MTKSWPSTARISRGFHRLGSDGPSLVSKFAVLSAVAFIALGFVLSSSISSRVSTRHLNSATHAAELISSLGIKPLFTPTDFVEGLSPDEVASLDRQLNTGQLGDQVVRLKVWNRDATVVYSDQDELIGQTFAAEADLAEALSGHIEAGVSDLTKDEQASERRFGRLLEVYIPIRFGGATQAAGAFELYLPYDQIEAAIADDLRNLRVRLVGGLLLLYVILFRIVTRASQRLKLQSDELIRRADEKEFIATHDALTGLPNRILFRERIERSLVEAGQAGTGLAVMILDLDRFKEVNDTLGHDSGDALLTATALRLCGTLDEHEIARLGGDEFGVLITDVSGESDVIGVAMDIRHALSEPFEVNGLSLDVSGSSGVALAPDHGESADVLLQRADVAMYVAKARKDQFAMYDPTQDNNSPERLILIGDLRKAIEQQALTLYYQPKVDLRSGRIVGVEALARWEHPEHGFVNAETFVDLAEQTGLIKPLTYWVLDRALAEMQDWRASGLDLSLAVNVSVQNLMDVALPEDVGRLLGRWDVPPEMLTIEITESAMMSDPIRSLEILKRLDAMGITLAVDDFGTGHSSLAYLKQLPVRELKIDRSFLIDMSNGASGDVIVRSTIDLAHNLNMRVVAEGVEGAATAEYLTLLGCETAQGYHFSRPLPARELVSWAQSAAGGLATTRGPRA